MQTIVCDLCGAENENNRLFCIKCGNQLVEIIVTDEQAKSAKLGFSTDGEWKRVVKPPFKTE